MRWRRGSHPPEDDLNSGCGESVVVPVEVYLQSASCHSIRLTMEYKYFCIFGVPVWVKLPSVTYSVGTNCGKTGEPRTVSRRTKTGLSGGGDSDPGLQGESGIQYDGGWVDNPPAVASDCGYETPEQTWIRQMTSPSSDCAFVNRWLGVQVSQPASQVYNNKGFYAYGPARLAQFCHSC